MLKFLAKKEKSENQKEIESLKKELEICKDLMDRNYTFFNMALDENLIESHIYEMHALKHKYDYLLKQIKEKEEFICYNRGNG